MTNRTLRLTALIGLAVSIGNAQDRGAQMDAYVQVLADAGRFQGSVLVAQNGATLLDKGYGPATSLALGARKRKVTVWLAWTSGEMMGARCCGGGVGGGGGAGRVWRGVGRGS